MADFSKQLQDKRTTERLADLDRKLDKAIGKDLDATLVPDFKRSERAAEMEAEELPTLDQIHMTHADRVKFTSLIKEVVEIMGQQAILAEARKEKMHAAKKIAHRNGITAVQHMGHRFRTWPI